MSYLVLARKYRPQTFEDLVGQEHVVRTLQNALRSGRIAHAYLFTGARGVGKTSSARILARALNCKAQQGSTPTPCGTCSPCVEISSGADLDVLEIDAASRTSVDDIRELQKTLAYVPSRDRFRVYIVDEVHMLSGSAFNAFLKTLEEPPAHVKFIFATTEPHKIPVTVLSRCQRYDFRLIGTPEIAGALRQILLRESIAADDAAVSLVAREAAGSMRDALSLLDQVVAFSGVGAGAAAIDGAQVARVLGIADRRLLFDLGAAIVRREPRRALELVCEVASSGHDVVHFSRELLAHLRNLVVVKLADTPGRLLDAPDSERQELAEQSRDRSLGDLERLFLGFSRSFEEIARSQTPRLLLEMAVARLAHTEPLLPVDELVGRLEALERRVAAPAAAPGPRPTAAPERPRSEVLDAVAPVAPPTPKLPAAAPVSTRERPTPSAPGGTPCEPCPAPPVAAMDVWRSILDRVGLCSRVLRSVLEHAQPLHVSASGVRVVLSPTSFHGRIATERPNVDLLRKAAEVQFGAPVAVEVLLQDLQSDVSVKSSSELRAEEHARTTAERVRAAEQLASVRAAVQVFAGAVKSVKTEVVG